MIGREKRMLLGHCLEDGHGRSAIARKLGISRDTVHRPIRTGELDRELDQKPVRQKARPAVATPDAPGLVTHFRLSDFARRFYRNASRQAGVPPRRSNE